ncbi:hypothetical protein D3C80_1586740 [compost metagenome]
MADRVEQQAADFDRCLAIGRAGAAQYGLQACNQLAWRKRLGDVVIGADFQALDLVVFLAFGGEHDDRDIPGQLIALEAASQFDTGRARQHPVEEDQVRLAIDDDCMGLLRILGFEAVIASHLQCHGDHFANRRFVVDDQNVSANHARCSCHSSVLRRIR